MASGASGRPADRGSATSAVNGNLGANLGGILGHTLWIEQLKAMGFTIVLATVSTVVLAYGVKASVGLRPAPEEEEGGPRLDATASRGTTTNKLG